MSSETQSSLKLWEKHPELFHYTTERGVCGILQSQSLFATHWRYLNDKEEVRQFHELLPELLRPVFRRQYDEGAEIIEELKLLRKLGANLESLHQREATTMADAIYKTLLSDDCDNHLFDGFITSFCTPDGDYKEVRKHGLLSQWRYYCENGGYAIVFDTEKFLALMHQENDAWNGFWSCGPVAYSSVPIADLPQRLEALPDLIEALNDCNFRTPDSVEPVLSPFLRCAVHYKHWAFSEEREVRLVIVQNGKKMMKEFPDERQRARSSFQRKDGSTVPCLRVFEGLPSDGPCRLPIKRIIVGPGPGQREREAKLKAFLAETRYDITVTCSEIPIRF